MMPPLTGSLLDFFENTRNFLGGSQLKNTLYMMMKVMYGVYVVEQVGNTPFNRAMLMNVGAAEAVKQQVSNKTVFLWIFLTQILLRITNASYSTMSTCCRRMTGICTPARYNLDTCPSPLTVSSTDFPMMISLVESVHSL